MDKQDPILPDQSDEVERYLLHQMPPEEEQAFVERLSSDVALKRSVDELRLILMGVQEVALAEKLDSFHEFSREAQQPVSTEKGGRIIPIKKLLLVACAVGFVILGTWFILSKKNETESLFVAYFKPDPGLLTAMSSAGNYAFDRAMVDYKTGNYADAIAAWTKLQAAQPANDTLNYFLGASHLAANDAGKAIVFFQKVASVPSGAFFYDANWYLGLSYLKEKNKEKAIVYLQKSNHPRKDALLAKLAE